MAKTVYDEVNIKLQDGRELTLRPLPIGLLRKFMTVWEGLQNVKEQFDTFDVFLNCAGVAISRELKSDFENKPLNGDGSLTDEYREYLEEVLDTPTIYEIIKVASGIDLSDPKLLEAAQEAAAEQETRGEI